MKGRNLWPVALALLVGAQLALAQVSSPDRPAALLDRGAGEACHRRICSRHHR